MSKLDVISDLSNQKLCEIPKHVLELSNLKMLYLEGNELNILPELLFTSLKKLVWLDLRKNKLKTIPESIAHHACLETLLLRDNEIKMLPMELGLLPKLKVLQLSGNPIIYPSSNIIQEGVSSIMSFLKQEYNEKHKEEQDFITDIKCIISDKAKNLNEKKKSKENYYHKRPKLKLKNHHKDNKSSGNTRHHKLHNSLSKSCGQYKDHPHYNSSRYLEMQSSKKNELRVEEQFLKDMWFKKLKEIMVVQEDQLQKQKNIDTLKTWRQNQQQKKIVSSLFDMKKQMPYDYDDDYYVMPSRKDLYSNQSGKKVHKSKSKPKVPNRSKVISEIIESLNTMGKERNDRTTRSPRSQMEKAGRDIQKIVELQKRLSTLKLCIASDM